MTTPNPPQENTEEIDSLSSRRPPPTPQAWRGVTQGLEDAAGMLQQHCYEEAEASLLQLLEFAPMEGKIWHLIGRCHQARGQHAKALECFAQAAGCYEKQTHVDEHPASARLARILWEQGEKHAARDMLEQLLESQAEDTELLALQREWEHETVHRQEETHDTA